LPYERHHRKNLNPAKRSYHLTGVIRKNDDRALASLRILCVGGRKQQSRIMKSLKEITSKVIEGFTIPVAAIFDEKENVKALQALIGS
jgi:hypothetical protein